MNVINARSPARIDLAGGTLDLWPLHLFFDNPATINCAIDQFADVRKFYIYFFVY
jgi:D-glycero-alpha-D-manno-heptose-7-phosphate kinase